VLHNLLHNLLLYAERDRQRTGSSYIKKGADHDYTTLFKDILYKDFRRVKTVGAFAQMINITEKRLIQATMSTLGKTPKQIIDEKIILEAKRLSIYTSNSIKEISYQLGFEETSNFIKYFKKHVDMTPIEFRESYNL
jgi:AraC-like DNA-binding protein